MLLAGADAGLEDGVLPMSHGFDLQQPAFVTSRTIVPRELRHSKAGAAVLILDYIVAAGKDLAFDHIFRVGDGLLFYGEAIRHLYGFSTDSPGDGQFVEPQRRGGGLKTAGHLDGRVYADGHGDGQGLTKLRGSLRHGADMPGARLQKDGQLVFALDAHAMDGHVRKTRVRVAGVAHAQGDIGPGVHRGVGGGGQYSIQIEVRIAGQVDHLLTGGGPSGRDGLDWVCRCPAQQPAQVLGIVPQQQADPFSTGQQANGYACSGISLHSVEYHGGSFLCGPLHGAACAHIAIDAGELRFWVHRHICLDQLAGNSGEKINGAAKVIYGVGHGKYLPFG